MASPPTDGALLNELCSICHANVPKYKCPRDFTRTCSLECIKKHKQRASCSGKRDPTAKLPKADVYTPATVDNDFNFISGIERCLDRKDRDEEERFKARKSTRKGELCLPKRNDAFQRRLSEMRTTIDQAPRGMARSRSNRTRWNPHDKTIIWTVEWVHNGQQDLRDLKDTEALQPGYASRFGQRRRSKISGQSSSSDIVQSETQPTVSTRPEPAAPLQQPPEIPVQPDDTWTSDLPPMEADQPPLTEAPLSKSTVYFYLHKVRVPSAKKVLIPLDGAQSLYHCLRNQTVLEYPTIYVFRSPLLPDDFVLEDDYLHQLKQEQMELDDMLKDAKQAPTAETGKERSTVVEEDWSPDRVMEVLKKDLTNIK